MTNTFVAGCQHDLPQVLRSPVANHVSWRQFAEQRFLCSEPQPCLDWVTGKECCNERANDGEHLGRFGFMWLSEYALMAWNILVHQWRVRRLHS